MVKEKEKKIAQGRKIIIIFFDVVDFEKINVMVLQTDSKIEFDRNFSLNIEVTNEMKQHHCKSIKNQNNKRFTCNYVIISP